MITIIGDGVPETDYYSDMFLKAFTMTPTPAGLVATITLLGNVEGQTTQEVQDKLDGVSTFNIAVTDSYNRNGIYTVAERPVIVPAEPVGVVFVGTRPFTPEHA